MSAVADLKQAHLESAVRRAGSRSSGGSAPPAGGYLWAGAGVALATVLGTGLRALTPLPNVSLLFLPVVLFAGARFGLGPALTAAGLSFLAYDFFFVEPLHSLTVAEPDEWLALAMLLLTGILTSAIAAQVRRQAQAAAARDIASRRLYEFTRRLSGLANPDEVLEGAAIQAHGELRRPCAILLLDGNELRVAAAWPPEDRLAEDVMLTARTALGWKEASDVPLGRADDAWLFLPLRSSAHNVGVIGLGPAPDGAPLEAEARTLFQTLAGLTGTALERARLAREIGAARSEADSERLRNTFLSAISHDFRTPLASILGAATSLIEYGERLAPPVRADLLAQVKDEAERLDAMVRNLLAMTRLEAGGLELRRDWVDIAERLHSAAALARRRGTTQALSVTLGPDLPLVSADPILIDQVIANFLDNAGRHAGPGARVELAARRQGDRVLLMVTDDGPGIPAELLPRIFDRFARAGGPRAGEGAGIGLAIAKGIVEAHGGSIAAESPVDGERGSRFTAALPIPGATP